MRILSDEIPETLLTPSSAPSATANSTSNALSPHGIYNDSSVSIVALGDGDKRLLFQEETGNIREALFTQSANSWTSDINNVVTTDARNNTPLAAVLVNSTGTPFADDTGPVVSVSYLRERTIIGANLPQDLSLLHNLRQSTRQQTIHLRLMDKPRQLLP